MFMDLEILKLEDLITLNLQKTAYKCIWGKLPGSIGTLCTLKENSQSRFTRTSQLLMCALPITRTQKAQRYISYKLSKAWNAIVEDDKEVPTVRSLLNRIERNFLKSYSLLPPCMLKCVSCGNV